MKQKFKKTKFFLCLLMVIAVSSCTTEEDVVQQHEHGQKINIEKKRFSELMRFNDFSKAISRLPKKKQSGNSAGRTAMEEQYGFEIVDTPVKVIEYEGQTYYTLQVVTDGNIDNKLENLVLYSEPLDENIGYIITYDIDKDFVETEASVKSAGIKDTQVLASEGSPGEGTGKFVVVSSFYSLCNGIPFNCGGSICGWGYSQTTIWISDFIPANPDSGGGNTGGGGSGNNNYVPPVREPIVITSPVYYDIDSKDPCIKLKTATNRFAFRNKVSQLNQPNVRALDHEKGFFETVPTTGASPYKDAEGTTASPTLDSPPGFVAFGNVHVHNDDYMIGNEMQNTIKMLSSLDVRALIVFQHNAIALGLDYSDAYVMMLSSQGNFAIKLLEPIPGTTYTREQWKEKWKIFKDEYDLKVKALREEGNFDSVNLQKMLLKLLRSNGFENKIGLYKATNNEATQWSRLTIDPANDNNFPINTPCN